MEIVRFTAFFMRRFARFVEEVTLACDKDGRVTLRIDLLVRDILECYQGALEDLDRGSRREMRGHA